MNFTICCAALLAGQAIAASLPVTEVVLYKNGIGYFVRSGEVVPGRPARLEFKAEDMNDVLKSLTLFAEGGARFTAVRYDSSEPLDAKLAPFPFRLLPQQPLSALLDQLKGARVELKTGPETLAGDVAGAREATGDDKHRSREELILLLDSGEIRTIDLGSVTSIRFTDPAVQDQFKRYLATVAAGRSREKRGVYIESTGDAAQRITASYILPAPVWKSSYRLSFTGASEPTLEGWAIVDNTTGEDWSQVRLALVSGRPVSFITNLYEPRMVERQRVQLPEESAVAPELHEGAVGVVGGVPGGVGGGVSSSVSVAAAPPPPPAATPMMKARQFAALDRADRERNTVSSFADVAGAGELGELFEYRFNAPVTVKSSESAMLPFLQQSVAARRLLIFGTMGESHPRHAVEISNSTGKTLDGGPITVFDAGAYSGEALMETLKSGDKRLVSYAVDLGTRLSTTFESSSDIVRELHARRGVLTVRSAIQETKTYTIRNVDQKLKTLVLEHQIRQGYKLLGKVKPAETTASAYRFELKLAPGADQKFPVLEERLLDQEYMLANATPDFLVVFVQNKDLIEAGRKQLERISKQKSLIADDAAELSRLDQVINETFRDQERLRQNMLSLNQVSRQQEQVQAYARQLAGQESKLATLRGNQARLRQHKATLDAELNALIENAEF